MDHDILVPLDGSSLGEAVLPYAVALARATSDPLALLRVVPPAADVERLERSRERTQAQIYLGAVAERLRVTGLVVYPTVVEGDPAASILERSARYPGTRLVAMATHGYTGLRRWLSGSVAGKMLNATAAPILLVRSRKQAIPVHDTVAYHKILVPLDGSAFANEAILEAQALAAATGATLCLVSVVHGGPPPVLDADDIRMTEAGIAPLWMLAEVRAELERVARHLDRKVMELHAQGLKVERVLAYGAPAEEILRASIREQADLIVMATHGWSGLQRMWLGSVGQQVLQAAQLPVLFVRPGAQPRPVGARRSDWSMPEAVLAGM